MLPGSHLGRYELHRILGRGGMGTVWAATLHGPAGFKKPVALKVLTDGGDGLVREARLGGLLRHPHLVEVYALEQLAGTWVCAMELVRGGSLSGFVLPPKAVVEVGIQVAQGLAHAHEEVGLVHLDLKPANLLLDHGRVKVADLGISRARGFVQDGKVQGTPAYMSPEHWSGDDVDARADIFSLGVVLVALATGEPGRHPDVVPWLRPVLKRCFPVEREARFQTMADVARALRQIEVDGPGLADWTLPSEERRAELQSGTTQHEPKTPSGSSKHSEPYRALTNLGPDPDLFIGRQAEIEDLFGRLSTPGLTTLKGTGGLGKTRLSRQVARRWYEELGHAAWFVDLSSTRTELGVLQAVGAVLEIPLQGGEQDALAHTVGWALQGRGPLLLVLDNFEQIIQHASVVQQLQALAPEARFLVTSREPLHLRGEQIVELGPLPQREAQALLITRATAKGFRATADDPDLPELVRQLDRLPLALELAASRLGVLSPGKMLARLDRRFALLKKRDPTLSAREATLRGTLDWSWDMLTDAEKHALAQCSVFADGFTVEAAEEVLEVPGDLWAIDVVESLVDRSLLTATTTGRIGMLNSVQAYAAEKVSEAAGDAEARHAQYYARLGEPAHVASLSQHGGVSRRAAQAEELENLQRACRYAIPRSSPVVRPLLAAIWSVLSLRGPYTIAISLALDALRSGLPGDEDRAGVHTIAGTALQRAGRNQEAGEHLDAGLTLVRQLGDVEGEARIRATLGVLHRARGDLDLAQAQFQSALEIGEGLPHQQALIQAEQAILAHRRGEHADSLAWFEQALAGLRAAGDRATEGRALGNLGNLHLDEGRVEQALRCYNSALKVHRSVGSRKSQGVVLTNLAGLHYEQGRLDEADANFHKALKLHREVGARAHEAHVLGDLGVVKVQRGQIAEAEASYRAALSIHREIGDRAAIAHAQYNLGGLLSRNERHDEATACLTDALSTYRALGDRAGEGCALANLSTLHHQAGKFAVARATLDEALALVQSVQLRRAEGSFLGASGWQHAMAGHPEPARADSARGEAILQAIQDPVQLAHLLCLRAEAEYKLGDAAAGARALARARQIAEELAIAPGSPLGIALQRATPKSD